jgi:hypothetical protein
MSSLAAAAGWKTRSHAGRKDCRERSRPEHQNQENRYCAFHRRLCVRDPISPVTEFPSRRLGSIESSRFSIDEQVYCLPEVNNTRNLQFLGFLQVLIPAARGARDSFRPPEATGAFGPGCQTRGWSTDVSGQLSKVLTANKPKRAFVNYVISLQTRFFRTGYLLSSNPVGTHSYEPWQANTTSAALTTP